MESFGGRYIPEESSDKRRAKWSQLREASQRLKADKSFNFFYDPLVILGQSCGFLVLKSRRD